MGNVAELDTTRLVIAAIIGLALLLVLIIAYFAPALSPFKIASVIARWVSIVSSFNWRCVRFTNVMTAD